MCKRGLTMLKLFKAKRFEGIAKLGLILFQIERCDLLGVMLINHLFDGNRAGVGRLLTQQGGAGTKGETGHMP